MLRREEGALGGRIDERRHVGAKGLGLEPGAMLARAQAEQFRTDCAADEREEEPEAAEIALRVKIPANMSDEMIAIARYQIT